MSGPLLLTINGLALPIDSAGDLTQEYEVFGGFTNPPLRFADGVGFVQSRWERLRTSISCKGWKPPALAGFDWRAPVTLGCVTPRGITQAGNVFTLPAARRSDVPVVAMSVHGPESRLAAVSVSGNTATVTPVAGANAYACHWYPLLTVYSAGPKERLDLTGAVSGWELTAEEI